MKNLLFLCSVFLYSCLLSTSAYAVSYTDTYTAGHVLMSGNLCSYDQVNWTFDITDDGYDPTSQTVTSATISLNLEDDGGWFDWWEVAVLDVGENLFLWEVHTGDVSLEIRSLMTLSETGKVEASLIAALGDFYFNSATLDAIATDPTSSSAGDTNPVPEPANVLLLGVGLVGLAGFMKKSKNWMPPK